MDNILILHFIPLWTFALEKRGSFCYHQGGGRSSRGGAQVAAAECYAAGGGRCRKVMTCDDLEEVMGNGEKMVI